MKSYPATSGATRAPRWRRRLRRTALVIVALLCLIGVLSIKDTLTGPPGVGHFDNVDGQRAYEAAYDKAFEAMPAPTASHDVLTDWGLVRVYEWAGPAEAPSTPILLVPGRSSGAPMWAESLPDFVATHRVLALDALGDAGLSIQGTPLSSFDEQAEWLDQVVSQLAPGGVHVVGHSFGGATAATYARVHPEHTRTLTLLDPVFTLGYPPAGLFAQVMIASLPFLPESVRNRALGRIGGAEYDDTEPMAVMISEGMQHYRASLPTPSPLTEAQRAELTMPCYVGLAEIDSFAAPSGKGEQLAASLPNATVKVWPGTTHSLPMQVADELAVELTDFWGQHE